MTTVIDNLPGLPDYRQITTLDGRDYVLRFLFNEREGKWYMSVSDESDDNIVHGVKIVPLVSLLRKVTDDRKPAGLLMARDLTAVDADFSSGEKVFDLDPGLDELGERVEIVYFASDELVSIEEATEPA